MLDQTKAFIQNKSSDDERSLAEMQLGFTTDEADAYEVIRNGLWAGISTFEAESSEDDQMAIMSATYLVDTLKKLGFKITRGTN